MQRGARHSHPLEHPIKRYCEQHGITQVEFAARVGLSKYYVRQISCGLHIPGARAAKRIVEKTGGEIGLVELLTWERPRTGDAV